MKWLVVFLFGMLIANQTLPEQTATFERANNAYLQGDYLTAVKLYESLLKTNSYDVNLYLNAGNAYFELDDPGHALLNYRRGLQLAPRDSELNENLTMVRTKRVDIQGDEADSIIAFSSVTDGLFTLKELNWLTWIAGIVLAVLIALFLVRDGWRRYLRISLITSSAIFALALLLLVSRVVVNTMRPNAVIIANSGQVMSGPGEQYLEIFRVHSATEVRLVDSQNGWLRFQLPDGRGGWIQQDSLEKIDP